MPGGRPPVSMTWLTPAAQLQPWRAATPADTDVLHHDGECMQRWRAWLSERTPAGAIDRYVRLQNPPKLWPSNDHCEPAPSPGSRADRSASASETMESALHSTEHVLVARIPIAHTGGEP